MSINPVEDKWENVSINMTTFGIPFKMDKILKKIVKDMIES